MHKAKVAILGASGRLGSLIGAMLEARYADRLQTVARLGSGSRLDVLEAADIVIDVSLPAGTEALVQWLESTHTGPGVVVSGTTGAPPRFL